MSLMKNIVTLIPSLDRVLQFIDRDDIKLVIAMQLEAIVIPSQLQSIIAR